jgi:hypothetical protein
MATEYQNLAKIFNNRLFRIPDYQRGYAWGERQLADFWCDLQRAGTDRTHYCGQLALEKAEKTAWRLWVGDTWLIEDAGYEPYFIVDGQQRVTTAVIVVQCLLEELSPKAQLAGLKVSELRERYLAKGDGVLKSCLFGYAKDNPSHEFFRTQILRVPSNDYRGTRTVYTNNLAKAKEYFQKQLEAIKDRDNRERIIRALTQRFLFNLHELNGDIDVFVAFETMNNRGKPLSRLELLKNRLIYLSTLADGSDAERKKVRENINAVWRTVYEELGRNPNDPLDDDEFLRAHWIVFFGFDKDEADPLTQFLLNHHFTTERLDRKELTLSHIQAYADSLQISARVWQRLHFPEDHGNVLGQKVTPAIVRLKRLGFGVLRPLLLAALSSEPEPNELLPVLHQAERFLLLVRSFAATRSHVGEADSYGFAHDLHDGTKTLSDAAGMLCERVDRHFSIVEFQTKIDNLFADEDGKGFYDLPGLKFVLFEYEEDLRRAAKASSAKIVWEDFRGGKDSVEHVYPQNPETDQWPSFNNFSAEPKRFLTHSLGNLVAVSVAKNASLSRRSFKEKKAGTDTCSGFNEGSFSELQIAQYHEWTATTILERGIVLLRFIEDRWEVELGSDEEKAALLKLDFDLDPHIERENTCVVLTRDGWVTRVGRLASVEDIPVREGDEVIAVVPGNTLDHVVFLADNGTAFTMQMSDVPASLGNGQPITNFFDLDDRVKIIAAVTTDKRFLPPDGAQADGGAYLLVVTSQGLSMRTPFAHFRSPSTKVGRKYMRLNDGDRVVMVHLVRDEETIFLVSVAGRVIHFPIREINIHGGAGKGVRGIKLGNSDTCLGGALISNRFDSMQAETTAGKILEFRRGRYDVTSRGGKGFEALRRSSFVRVIPPPIQLVDWDAFETKDTNRGKDSGRSQR